MIREANDRLKQAFIRKVTRLERRPSAGRGTAKTRVRIQQGARCEIEEGPWRIVCDLPALSGGHDLGPDPGVLGRGALGSSLAMTYMMWAAKEGIRVDSLEVEIHADYDAGSQFGVSEAPPGYTQIRYVVRVETPAPRSDVTRLLDAADAHAPYLDVFARPQEVHREVHLVTPAGA